MYYDFIEIGTSDFNTLMETCNTEAVGLSIEPIKRYLEALPNKPRVKKLNMAVSNHTGEISLYSIVPELIELYKLPPWLRGCNSVNKFHPTALKIVQSHGLPLSIFAVDNVRVVDAETLIKENNIEGCHLLKVDTGGHDCIILNNYLDYCDEKNINLYPNIIQFESNSLKSESEYNALLTRCQRVGYKVVSRDANDTILERVNVSR